MKLQDAIEKRRSIRKFSDKKVSWDMVLEAIDAANQAPFAGNINNLQFIIVSDQENKNQLAKSSQQTWIADAPYIVVVCAETKKLENHYDKLGIKYSKQQAGAAIENFLLKITDMKLASCWIGAFSEEQIKSTLKIPEKYDVEAILPIGKEKGKIKAPRKHNLETSIHWDKWGVQKKPIIFKDPSTSGS
ncbi:MAG: nitroreductase family protein [Candidatus Pacearchaeota archaeon]|nr:nitroreductase family protein [Candidatus Pacearchaeota archaeon]